MLKPRRMRWELHVARIGREEEKNAYRLIGVKPEGKRPLGNPRRGWVDNIKLDIGGLGLG
jgi:hypothetical protein